MYALLPGPMGSNLGFFQVPSPAAAQTIAAAIGTSIPRGSNGCLIQVIGTNGITWRDDGVAPTGTVGMTLLPNQPPMWFSGAQMRAMQFILVTATSPVNIAFYGQ